MSRVHCTDVVALFEVRGFEVASTADHTALICSTGTGIVKLILPTALFVEKARAERDCNGRPLPAVSVAKEVIARQEALRRELEEDAAAARSIHREMLPSPGAEPARLAFTPSLDDGVRPARTPKEDYEAAWEFLRANLTLRVPDVAQRFGFTAANFQGWMNRYHYGELATLREAAGLNRLGRPKTEDGSQRTEDGGQKADDGERTAVPGESLPPVPESAYPPDAKPIAPESPVTLAELRPLPPSTDRAARELALRRAWGLFIASPELSYWDVAQPLGCTPSYLRRQFDAFAAAPGAPRLKPNGKL